MLLKSVTSDYSQTVSTDADVVFGTTSLPVGAYRVTVTRDGFGPASQEAVIASGSEPVAHFQLALGTVQQEVNVQESR